MIQTPNLELPIREWMPIVTYPGYMESLPDIVLGKWPAALKDGYKSWIAKTAAELLAVHAALDKPAPRQGRALDFRSGPDAAVARPCRGNPFAALYAPPTDGWPCLAVFRWPRKVGREIGAAREVYTWDAFATQSEAIDLLSRTALRVGGGPIVTPDGGSKN